MTPPLSEPCLAVLPRGGFCRRLIHRRYTLDHCAQHGGRYMPDLLARWLAGESIEAIATSLEPPGPLAPRMAYIERMIRRYAGGVEVDRCSTDSP